MSDKSRERFEAWFGAAWGFPPWSITDDQDDARDADITWSAWQARDAEVKELVEALKTAEATFRGLAEVSPDFSAMRHWSDCANEVADILAKHEGGR